MIEAMADGLYPVVGDIPGVREWMDGTNGELYDLSNTGSLTKAIGNILGQSFNISETLRENHAKAKQDGLFSNNIKETIALMQKRIENFGAKN